MPPKGKGKRKAKEETSKEDKNEAGNTDEDKKEETVDVAEEKPDKKSAAKKAKTDDVASSEKGEVHIISSKACQAFAKRHTELEALIKKAKPDVKITIEVQPKLGTKPDKGSFIVEIKGKKIVELIAMPRPFDKMKALSMDVVAADVLKELCD